MAVILEVSLISIFGYLGAFRLVLVAPAVLLGLSAYWCQWVQTHNALHERIQSYQQLLQDAGGPFPCERGSMRAITCRDLCDFHEVFGSFIRQRNTKYVTSNIVMPLTRPRNLSLAELMCSGLLNYYVSYLGRKAFADLVTSVHKHCREVSLDLSTRYWISAFAQNKHETDPGLANGHLEDSSFFQASSSSSCKGICVVFADAETLETIFNRSWCIFEIYSVLDKKRRGHDVEDVLFRTPSGSLAECSFDFVIDCVRRLRTIDPRQATASSLEDEKLIDDYMNETGGWAAVGTLVLESIRKAALSFESQSIEAARALKIEGLLKDFTATLCPCVLACPAGPRRGISAGQLSTLQSFFTSVLDGCDMYWTCDHIVKPVTSEKRVSYAELVGCEELKWFISHWWGMHFNKTVESVVKHAASRAGRESWEGVRYWICTFSNNQWAMDEEIPPGAPPQESSFYKALRSTSCQGSPGSTSCLFFSFCVLGLLYKSLSSQSVVKNGGQSPIFSILKYQVSTTEDVYDTGWAGSTFDPCLVLIWAAGNLHHPGWNEWNPALRRFKDLDLFRCVAWACSRFLFVWASPTGLLGYFRDNGSISSRRLKPRLNSGKCSIDTAMAIGQELTSLRLENAHSSKEDDKQLIFRAVEDAGGFDAINSKLRQKIREVIGTVANQFTRDLQQLQMQLGHQIVDW